MQIVTYLKGTLSEVEYLCRMISSHQQCHFEIHTIIGKQDIFTIKVKRYANICKSVLLSCLPFAKVTIVDEDEIFKGEGL